MDTIPDMPFACDKQHDNIKNTRLMRNGNSLLISSKFDVGFFAIYPLGRLINDSVLHDKRWEIIEVDVAHGQIDFRMIAKREDAPT